MLAVIIAWVFFRAETFSGAIHVLSAMVGLSSHSTTQIPLMANATNLAYYMFPLTLIVALLPNSIEITRNYRPVISAANEVLKISGWRKILIWRPSPKWALAVAFIGIAGLVQIYRLNGLTEFIYFNF